MCLQFWTSNQKYHTALDYKKNSFLEDKDPFQSLTLGSFEKRLRKQSDLAL